MLPLDLYFSTKSTKIDTLKHTNRTYNYPEESVKFWWVSDLIKWVEMDVRAKQPFLYSSAI